MSCQCNKKQNDSGLDSGLLTRKHSTKAQESDGDLKKRLFSQLSKKMVSALQDKYRIDLTMFEYDAEEYMQLASDSEGFMPICDIVIAEYLGIDVRFCDL